MKSKTLLETIIKKEKNKGTGCHMRENYHQKIEDNLLALINKLAVAITYNI